MAAKASTIAAGKRVQLHPAFDAWMQGDRFGEVVGPAAEPGVVRVKMDISGRTLRVRADDLREVEG